MRKETRSGGMEVGERREKEDKAREIQIGGGLLGRDDTSEESLLFRPRCLPPPPPAWVQDATSSVL